MKHKKYLFTTFFLLLFVFQQTQAYAKISPNMGDLFSYQSPQASGLPDKVLVYMYQFTEGGDPTSDRCRDQDTTLGCVESFSNFTYPPDSPYVTFPYGGVNPILVDVENYYLKNVLPREMNVAENYPTLAALQAQALAARSIADWKTRAFGSINFDNTTRMQVFVPGSYEKYKNPNDPAAALQIQGWISDAITSTNRQYLSYNGNGESIDAEFGSDMFGNTNDEPAQYYLEAIKDPISEACDAGNNSFGGYGMSQKGAIRWSLGNQCANPNAGNSPWPVTWTDYRQILAHYYTGIDILDASGVKVAPDDRWNLLNYTVPNGTTVNAGSSLNVNLTLQNTSTTNWADKPVIVGYKWRETDSWTDVPNAPVQNLQKGASTEPPLSLSLSIPVPTDLSGTSTLYLDLRRQNDSNSWFSLAGWPDAKISPITVIGSMGILISQGSDDGGTNPGDCAFYNTDNEVYLGACFGGGDITSGFRFQNVQIPRNANIESAYVNFTVDGTYITPIQVQIYGEASVNPLTYSASSPPTNRITTSDFSSPLWSITEQWELGERYNTPDISSVIRAIINRPDWNSGQPISIIIKNAGSTDVRRVVGFERAGFDPNLKPAQLVVTYNLNPTPTPTVTPINSTPQPAFTPTSIPPTYTHIAPTIAPTPVPTPNPCPLLQLLQIFGIGSSNSPAVGQNSLVVLPSLPSIQQAVIDINLFYDVRDQILSQTVEGQRYIDLYYANGPEISKLLLDNRDLANEALATLQLWQPNLQAWVNGQGSSVTITQEQVQAIQTFLGNLSAKGSPELLQTIANEEAQRPLEQVVGMNMDNAWTYLNGYQLAWLPPISNSNPYSAQQGSEIPVKFTVTDFEGNFVIDETLTLQVSDSIGNVVIGPIQIGDNPNNGIKIQEDQYHYNLKTKDLPAGSYNVQVTYNSSNGAQSETRSIILTKKKGGGRKVSDDFYRKFSE